MDFSMKKLTAIQVNGITYEVVPGTILSRPIVDGYVFPDHSSAELASGGYIIVKDQSADALIFSDKEIRH